MDIRPVNLLDEALGFSGTDPILKPSWPLGGKVVLIEDCVVTSGSFVIHHLIKRVISPQSSSAVVFIAFAQPFSHYDRILKKMGCNLAAHKENNRFVFLDMLTLDSPGGNEGDTGDGGLVRLYGKVCKAIRDLSQNGKNCITVMVDDISIMEVATRGSSSLVLDFLHYCHTLTLEFGCSLVILSHEDIYRSTDKPSLIMQMEYLANIVIKTEPLSTGLATDVHGQLTVLNKGTNDLNRSSRKNICNFQFKVKENGMDYFYPGSRT